MVDLTLRMAPSSRRGAAWPVRPQMRTLRSVRRFLSRLAVEWRDRQAIRHVEGLDDAMLRDIGLPRGGIEDAVRNGRAHFR